MRDFEIDYLAKIRVRDVMSGECWSVAAEQTMDSAAEEFLNRRVSGMPVVDAEGQAVGVISTTDFIWHERSGSADDPVQLYMSPKVQAVRDDQFLLDAAQLMLLHHIHRVIVVDDQSRPIGVVSSLDVVEALFHAATGISAERLRALAQ